MCDGAVASLGGHVLPFWCVVKKRREGGDKVWKETRQGSHIERGAGRGRCVACFGGMWRPKAKDEASGSWGGWGAVPRQLWSSQFSVGWFVFFWYVFFLCVCILCVPVCARNDTPNCSVWEGGCCWKERDYYYECGAGGTLGCVWWGWLEKIYSPEVGSQWQEVNQTEKDRVWKGEGQVWS
jgi:hypothetical protein